MKIIITILTIIFISFGISSCAIDEKINNLSDHLMNKKNVVTEKETRVFSKKSNINQEKNKKIEMINWKCVPLFSDEHALTLGYFINFKQMMFAELDVKDKMSKKFVNSSEEFGMIELKSTGKKFPAVYILKGVKHVFAFGGDNFTDFMIEIDNSNRGRYYNFQDAKPNQKISSEESYQCIRTKELVNPSNLEVWTNYFDNSKTK